MLDCYAHFTKFSFHSFLFDPVPFDPVPFLRHFVTGSYDSNFVVNSLTTKGSETIHATSDPVNKKQKEKTSPFSFRKSSKDKKLAAKVAAMDFAKKTLKVAWHPKINAVAVGSLNKVFIYQAQSNG